MGRGPGRAAVLLGHVSDRHLVPGDGQAGRGEAFAFLDGLKIAKLAVSPGGTETLASHPASMTHLSVPDAPRAALRITDNLVCISVGGWRKDADDLIADFEQALVAM